MTRLEGRYTRKVNSRVSGIGRQSRPREVVVRTAGRLSATTGRGSIDTSGAGDVPSLNARRHDWLVPMELP